jgi:membrane-associated phospholipid phosphatase
VSKAPLPPDTVVIVSKSDPPDLRRIGETLLRNIQRNFEIWLRVIAPAPRARILRPTLPAIAAIIATLYLVVMLMFLLDARATDWAHSLPRWVRDWFEDITNFGLSGWFLVPFALVLLCLAALISPALSRLSQNVLTALAVRFGFLFLAVGVPGLIVAILKRMIGRARPSVGLHDDPFAYMPFIWKPEYASLPSGHATTAVAAAIAIGAIWPRTGWVMGAYAIIIMLSRVVVVAHHPSDVVAGALAGAAGAYLMRRWFAGRRLLFRPRDLQAYPGPSWHRIAGALREAVAALRLSH